MNENSSVMPSRFGISRANVPSSPVVVRFHPDEREQQRDALPLRDFQGERPVLARRRAEGGALDDYRHARHRLLPCVRHLASDDHRAGFLRRFCPCRNHHVVLNPEREPRPLQAARQYFLHRRVLYLQRLHRQASQVVCIVNECVTARRAYPGEHVCQRRLLH